MRRKKFLLLRYKSIKLSARSRAVHNFTPGARKNLDVTEFYGERFFCFFRGSSAVIVSLLQHCCVPSAVFLCGNIPVFLPSFLPSFLASFGLPAWLPIFNKKARVLRVLP